MERVPHDVSGIPKSIGSNDTVHGSLSKYDSNVAFLMFSPVMSLTDNKRSAMHDFFIELYGSDYATKPLLTTDIGKIVEEAIRNSNKLFMGGQ